MRRLGSLLLGSSLTLLLSSSASAAPRLLAAEHDGSVGNDSITWRSRVVIDCGGEPGVVLRSGEPEVPCGRELHEISRQPLDRTGPMVLRPPFFTGEIVQVVTARGRGDERVEPSPGGLERHVGYWRSAGVTDEARHAASAALHRPTGAVDEEPLFLDARGAEIATRGIPVVVTTAADRRRPAVVATAVASVVLLLALAWLYRRLSREVEIERAEAALKREFEGLEGG